MLAALHLIIIYILCWSIAGNLEGLDFAVDTFGFDTAAGVGCRSSSSVLRRHAAVLPLLRDDWLYSIDTLISVQYTRACMPVFLLSITRMSRNASRPGYRARWSEMKVVPTSVLWKKVPAGVTYRCLQVTA